jgi:hypothetical protein
MKHKYLRQSAEMASLCAYNYTQCYTDRTHWLWLRIKDGKCAARRAVRSHVKHSEPRCMQLALGISLLCFFVHAAQTNTHVRTLQLAHSHYFNGQPAESRLTHAAAE